MMMKIYKRSSTHSHLPLYYSSPILLLIAPHYLPRYLFPIHTR